MQRDSLGIVRKIEDAAATADAASVAVSVIPLILLVMLLLLFYYPWVFGGYWVYNVGSAYKVWSF